MNPLLKMWRWIGIIATGVLAVLALLFFRRQRAQELHSDYDLKKVALDYETRIALAENAHGKETALREIAEDYELELRQIAQSADEREQALLGNPRKLARELALKGRR